MSTLIDNGTAVFYIQYDRYSQVAVKKYNFYRTKLEYRVGVHSECGKVVPYIFTI